jgi:hypothetical protein
MDDDNEFKLQIIECGITECVPNFFITNEVDLFNPASSNRVNYDRVFAFYKWKKKGYQHERTRRKVNLLNRELNGRFMAKPMVSITQKMNEIYHEDAKPEDYYNEYYQRTN